MPVPPDRWPDGAEISRAMAQAEVVTKPVADAEVLPANWQHNFIANFADVSFFSLGMAFVSLTTIIPLFIRQLGGSTLLVGIVPALVQTGWLLPPLFVAPYIGRMRRKLPYVLRATIGERVTWVIMAAFTFFLAADYPRVVLILAVVSLAVFGL